MELKVKPLSEKIGKEIPFPYYASEGAAAMDLHACIETPVTIKPLQRTVIPTGIAIELPSTGYVALIFARSGLGIKHGVTLSNCVGVIDSDYRGEIGVGMINLSESEYIINPADRIAQIGVFPVARCDIKICEELSETNRGAGAMGSTGK